MEVHIADDGDEMRLDDYKEFLDTKTVYHKVDSNGGASSTKNFLIQQVKSEYTLVIDDDLEFTVMPFFS